MMTQNSVCTIMIIMCDGLNSYKARGGHDLLDVSSVL